MLQKLFTKPIADLSENEVLEGCVKATYENLSELKQRHHNIHIDPKAYSHNHGETDVEWRASYECLMRKRNALYQAIQRLEEEQKQQQIQIDKEFVEKSVMENLAFLRYCVGDQADYYSKGIITQDCLNLQKTTTPIIPVQCKSGYTKNLDLTKLKRSFWERLLHDKILTLIVQGAGYLDTRTGIVSSCWQKMEYYVDLIALKEINETLIVLMVV